MLPDQNNFSFCLYIFCFISFHSCRGVCCHLAFVATSYRMQHSKEKKYSIFTWKLESDFQRKGTKSCLPKSKSLQAHAARATQRTHVEPCQSWAEELPCSSLFLSLFLLVSPPLYSSPQGRRRALGPLSHPVTLSVRFPRTQWGVSKQDDSH